MLLSHGAILRVLSRVAQHILGQHVAQFGWQGAVQLSEKFRTELAKLLDCLVIFNKKHIYSAASGVTVDVNKIQQLKSRCRATGLQLAFMMDSDLPMAFAYHLMSHFVLSKTLQLQGNSRRSAKECVNFWRCAKRYKHSPG